MSQGPIAGLVTRASERFAGLAWHESRSPPPTKGHRGQRKRRRGHNRVLRLQDNQEGVLRFTRDPTVPATNNEAERALRPLKVQQKISGSFRSTTGARNHAVLRTVLDTARKQAHYARRGSKTARFQLRGWGVFLIRSMV
ncbi:MAG: transposase, partial [Rhodobacteraceae bacterium]|nr:transposase [Paracoccaceae bacterium]